MLECDQFDQKKIHDKLALKGARDVANSAATESLKSQRTECFVRQSRNQTCRLSGAKVNDRFCAQCSQWLFGKPRPLNLKRPLPLSS